MPDPFTSRPRYPFIEGELDGQQVLSFLRGAPRSEVLSELRRCAMGAKCQQPSAFMVVPGAASVWFHNGFCFVGSW